MLEKLKPFGVKVTGVPVDTLSAPVVGRLRRLLADHAVLVLPRQDVDDRSFVRFLRSFGPTMFTAGETPVPGHPELNVVSNVGRVRPPKSSFHTDTSYVDTPPAYTALRAVCVPDRGGQTLFADQRAAYDSLPAEIWTQLLGRTITHVVTDVENTDDQQTAAVHPVFLTHPVSGRAAVYLTVPRRCADISGMSAAEAAAMVSFLYDHCTRDEIVYRHRWSPGDVVMWDNRCVLHCADHSGVDGDRVMHRGMVLDAAVGS